MTDVAINSKRFYVTELFVTHNCHHNFSSSFYRNQIVTLVLDHLAMDDSIWGNLFSADDPMAPQLEFRGGNGHTGKSIIIRSGTEPKPPTQHFPPSSTQL